MTPGETGLSEEEMAALKKVFVELECAVTNLEGDCFEISHAQYPIATHVHPTAYFLQFSTVIIARPKGFPFRTRTRLLAFLNRANSNSKLTKFYLEGNEPKGDFGGWMIMANTRFVRGVIGADWERDALKNCLNLWLQDIAEFVLLPGPFGLESLKREKSN
jgi:hypothetical protein